MKAFKKASYSQLNSKQKENHNFHKLASLLASKNPEFSNNFTYSLHHVFPRTVSKNDVLYYESLLKNKLGSRAYGLNEN
jgi:hypothetical protein